MNHVYESILNMVKFYDSEIARCQDKQQILFNELKSNLRKDTGLENPTTTIDFWGWDCRDSVIGKCVYDDDADPAHDNCIYCNEPAERENK